MPTVAPFSGRFESFGTIADQTPVSPIASAFTWRTIPDAEVVFTLLRKWPTVGHLLRSFDLSDPRPREVFVIGEPGVDWGMSHGEGWDLTTLVARRAERPVFRYRHGSGVTVAVANASAWFGADITEADARRSYVTVAAILRGAFHQPRPLLLPAMTGRDCWTRSIDRDVSWPTLSLELQTFIRSTGGQGRVSYLPFGTPPGGGDLYEIDGRTMYGALCAGLPTGEPILISGPGVDDEERWRYASQRALVEWCAPPTWDHVGILPAKAERGWCYPRSGVGWVDGSELHLALTHGWRCNVRERIVWPGKGRPVDVFARKLVRAREGTTGPVSVALRKVLIETLGSFQCRPMVLTRFAELEAEIPEDEIVRDLRIEGDRMVWETVQPLTPYAAKNAHPEWSAAVWGRARARVLDSPTGQSGIRAGVLHLEPSTVLAVLTDAIVTTCDPGWPDDGRAGRLRVKSVRPVDRWPSTATEIHRMKG